MFAQSFQSGYISLLYSIGCAHGCQCTNCYPPIRSNYYNYRSPRPLQLCEKQEETHGSVRRVLDEEVQSSVVELSAQNLVNTWLRFPFGANEPLPETTTTSASLHIRLRHLVLVLKNLEQHVSLEVQAADNRGTRRRFRFSTFQTKSVVNPQLASLPLHMESGWNQLQLDLADLMRTCYNARYGHAISVQLHASCRVRRIYFAEQMFPESQLPVEFRLFKRLSKEQIVLFRQNDRGH